MRRLVGTDPFTLLVAVVVALAVTVVGCAAWRLGRLPHYQAGVTLRGPAGGYALVPPTGAWVRIEENEQGKIDLALARDTANAWLNVSVAPGRGGTPEEVLSRARAEVDALLATAERREELVSISSLEGTAPARLGVYCGTFDRELRAGQSCFVLLGAVRN